MQQLHERMPVILEPEAWSVWLGQDSGAVAELMRLAANDLLRMWPVSRAVTAFGTTQLSRWTGPYQ